MKRIIAVLISLALLLTLCACRNASADVTSETEQHIHRLAEKPETVSNPATGYCGNTQTTIYFGNGKRYTFMYENSVAMTDILFNLDYDPNKLCKCRTEYTVDTEFGTGYGINISSGYARCDKGQANLTKEQTEKLNEIILWAQSKAEYPEYTDQWLEKTEENKCDDRIFEYIDITEIYSNCFFAETAVPMPYKIKLNGQLSDKWCVGDRVTCTYKNTYYDKKSQRVEADMLTIKESDWQSDPNVAYKPVIYLYPEKETRVSVNLELNGQLTCTYPEYKNGWQVTAKPDGTLADASGQIYNYLYWEGETYADYDLSKGFCVKGADTAQFLETALKKLGLNRKEANEFIVYWLPIMQDNTYNIISFQTDVYTDTAKLNINPTPNTLIRVFMAWKPSDAYIKLPKQTLSAPERRGFTAVEWGGTKVTK